MYVAKRNSEGTLGVGFEFLHMIRKLSHQPLDLREQEHDVMRHGDAAGISGDTVGIPEAPLRYPHPIAGRASVGARASCPLIPSHACVFR